MSGDVEPPSDDTTTALDEARRLLAERDFDGAWTALQQVAGSGRPREVAAVSYELGRRLLPSGTERDAQRARAAFELAYESGDDATVVAAAMRLGRVADQNGDVESARRYFERAAQSDTAHMAAAAAFELGALLQRAGDVDGAERWYRRAMHNEDGRSASWLAAMYLGIIRQAAGDPDSARELFQWALENGGEKIPRDAAYKLGDLLMRGGATALAEPWLKLAVQARHPAAPLSLGRLLAASGRLTEAEVVLREAADSYGDVAALTALGDVLVRRVDPGADLAHLIADQSLEGFIHHYSSHLPPGPEITEAEELYRQAVAAGDRSALVSLGHMLMGTDRGPEAERVLRQAVQAGAAGAEAVLATLLHSRGEDEAAAHVLEPAVAAGNAAALMVRADLYQHEDRLTETVDLLRRAVAAGGAPLGAGMQLFVFLAHSGDLEAARDALREMITLNDQTGMATVRALLADQPALVDDFQRACDSGSFDAIHEFTTHFVEGIRD